MWTWKASDNGNLPESKERWQSAYAKAAERSGERADTDFRTSSTETKPIYTPDDLNGDYNRDIGYPGEYPYTRGVQPTMYRGRLWSIRQYAGYGTAARDERALQVPAERGPARPLRRLRPADAARLRLRRPALARRSRQGRRRHRHARRHGGDVRRHPARPGQHLDDHQRPRLHPRRDVRRRRREAGRPARPHPGHVAERRPQGVRRARHLHLSAEAVAAPRRRPHGLLRDRTAALQPDQHQRLPHPRRRLDRRPGDGLHLRQRHRLHRRRDRARRQRRRSRPAHLLDLQHPEQLPRRGRQVPRPPPHVGEDHARALQSRRRALVDVPHARPDRRRDPHRAAARGQHRPRRRSRRWRQSSAASSRSPSPATTKRSPSPPKTRSASPSARSR